jgi:hypothetical protein
MSFILAKTLPYFSQIYKPKSTKIVISEKMQQFMVVIINPFFSADLQINLDTRE